MKALLLQGFGLSAMILLSACEPRISEPRVDSQIAEDVVNDWEDPFGDPDFFDPPNAETIARWRYILRYT